MSDMVPLEEKNLNFLLPSAGCHWKFYKYNYLLMHLSKYLRIKENLKGLRQFYSKRRTFFLSLVPLHIVLFFPPKRVGSSLEYYSLCKDFIFFITLPDTYRQGTLSCLFFCSPWCLVHNKCLIKVSRLKFR